MTTPEEYARMQIHHYQGLANVSSLEPGNMFRDEVVGCFHSHNEWKDYQDFLFKHSALENTGEMLALDFGCGPGRNIVLFHEKFKRIDGVDLSAKNLEDARIYTSVIPADKKPNFYQCNGLDLQSIPDQSYDVVFSTICLQHIACHSVRYNYFKEFLRVLKPGGFICIQMGYDKEHCHSTTVPYLTNAYGSSTTNGSADTRVEDPEELNKDLTEIGFASFEFNIRPSGPGDWAHPNWIFFSGQKPSVKQELE